MAAAANPKITCRIPEYQKFFPVNKVIAEPIRNNPKPLKIVLTRIAFMPTKKKNGAKGMIAPMANNKKEVIAASIAEPFKSSLLMPNSSLIKISCA